MHFAEGRFTITFNGEIYNYKYLKAQLENLGHTFRSTSDTEVILALYSEFGSAMLPMLRGMFALAIWDNKARTLFLARDPFGIKPLYISDTGSAIHFASQVKALTPLLEDTTPDPAGHVGFLVLGHVPEPFTLYKGIRALRAGHHATFDESGSISQAKYASVRDALLGPSRPYDLHDVLRSSVEHHYVADVPVSLFLSAGRDSGCLLALSTELPHNSPSTVTLGFTEYQNTEFDETVLASEVAAAYGAKHRTVRVSSTDFRQEVGRVFEAMDQPSIDGINTYFVSKAAADLKIKVVLSGLGGDEMFGGYSSFQQVPRLSSTLHLGTWAPGVGRAFRQATAAVLPKTASPKYAGLLEYGGTIEGAYLLRRGLFMPWELDTMLDADFARHGWDALSLLDRMRESTKDLPTPYARVAALEMDWYMRDRLLRDSDWASMAHSLELRVPFVDYELLRMIGPKIASEAPPSKANMAASPKKTLPQSVLSRVKTGFSVPVREWASGLDASHDGEVSYRRWAKIVFKSFCSADCLSEEWRR